jgi:ribosome-binding factor A
MPESRRVQRVQKELNHLVSQYLRTDWKGPCPGLLSVVHVDVMPDLRSAMIYISVITPEKDGLALFEELVEDQRNLIQSFVARNLRMKFLPRLNFKLGTYGDSPLSPPDEDSGLN